MKRSDLLTVLLLAVGAYVLYRVVTSTPTASAGAAGATAGAPGSTAYPTLQTGLSTAIRQLAVGVTDLTA